MLVLKLTGVGLCLNMLCLMFINWCPSAEILDHCIHLTQKFCCWCFFCKPAQKKKKSNDRVTKGAFFTTGTAMVMFMSVLSVLACL